MLLKKFIKVILKILNDPEINTLIRNFVKSLADDEVKELDTSESH